MASSVSPSSFEYIIDRDNRIVRVGRNWGTFARANDADDICQPKDVVGKSLFDFFANVETRYLYEMIVEWVRSSGEEVKLPFRCDSARERRYLELLIKPAPYGWIEFNSTIVKTEARESVRLLETDTPRSASFLSMCSMCKKAALPDARWVEVEEAVVHLRLFDSPNMPQISHGLCPDCFSETMEKLDTGMS